MKPLVKALLAPVFKVIILSGFHYRYQDVNPTQILSLLRPGLDSMTLPCSMLVDCTCIDSCKTICKRSCMRS